jgi:hypothetical protein
MEDRLAKIEEKQLTLEEMQFSLSERLTVTLAVVQNIEELLLSRTASRSECEDEEDKVRQRRYEKGGYSS